MGYNAINIPGEHSVSRRFWRRIKPDVLVYLSCTLVTARARRDIAWGQERLDEQWEILAEAKQNADLIVATDPFTPDEVLAVVVAAIEKVLKEKRCDQRTSNTERCEGAPPHSDIP